MRAEYSQQHDHDHHLIVFFFERNQSGVGGCKDRLGLFASPCIEERNDGFGDDFVKTRTYLHTACRVERTSKAAPDSHHSVSTASLTVIVPDIVRPGVYWYF